MQRVDLAIDQHRANEIAGRMLDVIQKELGSERYVECDMKR